MSIIKLQQAYADQILAMIEQIDNWTYSMKRASLDATTLDVIDDIPF